MDTKALSGPLNWYHSADTRRDIFGHKAVVVPRVQSLQKIRGQHQCLMGHLALGQMRSYHRYHSVGAIQEWITECPHHDWRVHQIHRCCPFS